MIVVIQVYSSLNHLDFTLTLTVWEAGGPPRPGMLPTPPMAGPPMMPMMGPPPHGMMPGGPGKTHSALAEVLLPLNHFKSAPEKHYGTVIIYFFIEL